VIDEFGLNNPNTEGSGYNYRDVLVEAKPYSSFKYIAINPQTQFSMVEGDHLIVQFEFRDFKYLSNVMNFKTIITDPEVMVGLKDASIELDFAALL
jgi:hypothetical protein